MNTPEWLNKYYELIKNSPFEMEDFSQEDIYKNEKAADLLFEYLCPFDSKIEYVDEIIKIINLEKLNSLQLITLLTVTLNKHFSLSYRKTLVNNIEKILMNKNLERVESLMSGLRTPTQNSIEAVNLLKGIIS